ncbi:hypothetical protein [Halotalea alkalilenta]|uniref:hypothetical protein n=1 Tax=Halotalea alkalilenta TaxID=376489 RepID=UPI003F89981F
MSLAVHAIDDQIAAVMQLVGQAQPLQALQAADQLQALALQPGFVEAFDLHPTMLADLAFMQQPAMNHGFAAAVEGDDGTGHGAASASSLPRTSDSSSAASVR